MSDDRPVSTDRWIAPLAIALVVEAFVAGFPWIESYRAQETQPQSEWTRVMLYLGQASLPALFGLVTLLAFRVPGLARASWALGFVAILGIQLAIFGGWLLDQPGGATFSIFHSLSAVQIALATPVLWGSALARLENPGHPRLQKAGRVAAGVIQLGFVFQFVARIRNAGFYQYMGSSMDPSQAVWMLGDVVESLLLLWATVESLRSTPDESAVRDRAAKVHKVLRFWILAVLIGWVLSNVLEVVQSRNLISMAHSLWTIAVALTVMLAATCIVARRYRLQFAASASLIQRSGGVQSTGEPS